MSRVDIRPVAAMLFAEELSRLARRSKAHWGYTSEQVDFWWEQLRMAPADLEGRPLVAAVEDDRIVGFYTLRPGPVAWDLDNLWVVPERIGHGIGRMLFEHALRTAATGGADEVTIDADPHAEAFYLHCGALRRGEVPAPIPGLPARTRPQLAVDAARLREALSRGEGRTA